MKKEKLENEVYETEEGVVTVVEQKQPIYKRALGFIKNNKKKFIIAGGAIAAVVLGTMLYKKSHDGVDFIDVVEDSDIIDELNQQ